MWLLVILIVIKLLAQVNILKIVENKSLKKKEKKTFVISKILKQKIMTLKATYEI